MISFGVFQLIGLVAALSGFGISPNPQAPAAPEVVKYAPDNADLMVHIDLQAVVPGNYKALRELPNHKAIQSNSEAVQQLRQAIGQIDAGIAMAKGLTGVDPITDIHSLTLWARIPGSGDPDVLIVVRGAFPANLLDKLAQPMSATVGDMEGSRVLTSPDGKAVLALTGGQVLFGTPDWVKPRLSQRFAPPRAKPGSLVSGITPMLARKPFFLVASVPSDEARQRMLAEVGKENVAADIISGHDLGAITLEHNGMSWTFQAKTSEGYERTLRASEGTIALLRSGHLATRGLADVLIAALPSYAESVPEIKELLRYKDDIRQFIEAVSGDGRFQATWQNNPRSRTVSVRASGKKLSDVIPAAGILPFVGGAAVFFGARPAAEAPEPEQSSRSAVSGPLSSGAAATGGLDVDAIYRAVKQARGM